MGLDGPLSPSRQGSRVSSASEVRGALFGTEVRDVERITPGLSKVLLVAAESFPKAWGYLGFLLKLVWTYFFCTQPYNSVHVLWFTQTSPENSFHPLPPDRLF